MRRASTKLLCGFALAALLPVAPAAAQAPTDPATKAPKAEVKKADPRDKGTVKPGVSAGGVDLGGMTLAQAQRALDKALASHLRRKVVVRAGGRRFELASADAGIAFDSLTTAKRAVRAAAPGAVPLKLAYSKADVATWLAGIAAQTDRPARDATLKITLRKVRALRSRPGVRLPQAKLAAAIGERLTTPGSSRLLKVRMESVRAAVNADDLRRLNGGTVITIDKQNFKLRLFKQLKFAKAYPVAIGQSAYPTPAGRFRIQNKQVDPVWSVPNSAWAGELQGTTVAGGSAANPLKARWMGIVNGVGIHGTGEDWSIGTAASHGCIRMHVWDVKALFRRVPVGTPVLIR